MNFIRSQRPLLMLLIASLAMNTWQFLHSQPAAEVSMRKPVATSQAKIKSATGPLSGKKAAVAQEDEEDAGPTAESAADIFSPEMQPEDYLIFGGSGIAGQSVTHGEPSGKVSPQRLKEMARMPVSQAERFRVQARLLLPGDRALDFGTSDFAAGQRIKFERTEEFPFPSSIAFARVEAPSPFAPEGEPSSAGQGSFPITPTTPAEFEFKNRGLEIELDLTPAPGSLVVGGSVKQTVFESFSRMPGEAFSAVWQDDVIFTDNKVLQPQFTTRESPFVAAVTAGQPIRIPVHTSFGQTFLELTCTPLE